MELQSSLNLICRLCGEVNRSRRIKCKIDDQSLNIEQKLIDCCRWRSYCDNENFPKHICISCFNTLEKCWQFAETVAATQRKLADSLERENESFSQAESPINITVDGGMNIKEEFPNCANSIDGLMIDNFNESYVNEIIDNKTNIALEIKCEPLEILEMLNESTADNEMRPEISATQDDDMLENYAIHEINFPHCLTAEEKNADGTVTDEALRRLQLVDWTVFQFQCHECNLSFKDNMEIIWHYKSKHTHIQFRHKCWLCVEPTETRSYTKRSVLTKHIIRNHLPHLAYCCKSCNKFYWDLKLFKKHRIHNTGCTNREVGNMQHICDQCGEIFTRHDGLKSHQYARHLSKEQKKVFECYLCRAIFSTRHGLKTHMWKHAGKKMIKCTICKKMVHSKAYSRHLKGHQDIRPFSCSYCDKTFKFSNRLKIHERTHTGDRPFKCHVETCDYRCADGGNIYKHMRQKHKMTFKK